MTKKVSSRNIIYKYPLRMEPDQWVDLPKAAKLLDVQEQDGTLMLWALVRVDETQIVPRMVHLRGTGTRDYIDRSWNHIATVQMDGYVWHLFEEE